jgi:hypothetical protein
MGECRRPDWQVVPPPGLLPQAGAVSVRDRMEHLCNNPDMADLHIQVTSPSPAGGLLHLRLPQASDEQWMWGQTSKDFIVSAARSVYSLPAGTQAGALHRQPGLPPGHLDGASLFHPNHFQFLYSCSSPWKEDQRSRAASSYPSVWVKGKICGVEVPQARLGPRQPRGAGGAAHRC